MNNRKRRVLAPRNPSANYDFVVRIQKALRVSDRTRAVELASRALAKGLEDPLFLCLRAQSFVEQGDEPAALSDIRRAISLAPRDVALRNSCGSMLIQLHQTREAIEVLREAVKLDSNFTPAYFNLGRAQENAGELADSRRSYVRAHQLEPSNLEILARLSSVALRQRDFRAAREFADRALAKEETNFDALAAQVDAAMEERDHARADVFLQRLLKAPAKTAEGRASALSLLGDIRHAQGRYDEAFRAYAEGNAEKQRIYAPRFGNPETASYLKYIEWLARYFAQADANRWSAGTAQAAARAARPGIISHAFLAGFPRSGTTLLVNVLASHPKIATLAEKGTLNAAVREFLHDDKSRDRLATLAEAEREEACNAYWRCVAELGAHVQDAVFVDENPFNSLWLPVCAKLFPNAKVIFAVRDPRDVVLSCFRRRFDMNLAMYNFLSLEGAARLYTAAMELSMIFREKLGLDWCEVRHESLVNDFDGEAARLCRFLGLGFDDAMREFAARASARAITTASALQIGRGLNSEGVGQWRSYARELEPVLPWLAPWVRRFGYPPD